VVGRGSDGHVICVDRQLVGARSYGHVFHIHSYWLKMTGGTSPSQATPVRILLRVDVAEWKDVSILVTFPGDTERGATLTGLRTSRPWPSDDHVTSYMQATFLNTSLIDKFAERYCVGMVY
jgi:hypothetical protein